MKRKKHEAADVPLSALIDIVFLLIIFFIVTVQIQREVVDYNIELAKSYYVEPPDEPPEYQITLNVNTEGDGPPEYSFRGNTMSLGQMKSMLMEAQNNTGQETVIIIRASADAKWRYVDKLNRIILDAGFYRVRHATEAKKKNSD